MARKVVREPKKTGHHAVPLVVHSDGARDVIVTGDFTKWKPDGIRLRRRAKTEWFTTLRLLPGEYQYRLIIDGEWRDHPEATRRVPNSFGTENCILTVR